jgi:hypothetical protein
VSCAENESNAEEKRREEKRRQGSGGEEKVRIWNFRQSKGREETRRRAGKN